jgi:hypothetical protein
MIGERRRNTGQVAGEKILTRSNLLVAQPPAEIDLPGGGAAEAVVAKP